jgi:hypothetical protein
MQPEPQSIALGGIVAALLIVEMRLLRRELKIAIAALIERSRRRDNRQRRRESVQPVTRRTPSQPVHEEWPDDESTDLHELMELERANARTRRDTQRRGERPPRPGTHHDR